MIQLLALIFGVTLLSLALFTEPYWTPERIEEHNK